MTQTYFRTGTVVPGDTTTNQPGGTLTLQYQKSIIFPTNIIRASVTLSNLEYRVNTVVSPAAKPIKRIGYSVSEESIQANTFTFYINALCVTANTSIFGNPGNEGDNGKSINLAYSVTAVCADPA